MNAIDYGQMVRMLMMNPQMVGDVIPFARRNPGFLNQTEGAGRRLPGGPSQWRTPEGVSAYEAQSGLRPGSLAPVNPNRGEVARFRPSKLERWHEQNFQRNGITGQSPQKFQAEQNALHDRGQPGYSMEQLRGFMNDPRQGVKFTEAFDKLSLPERLKFIQMMNKGNLPDFP